MSELKSFRVKEVEDGCPFWQAEYEVYSKSEADKKIAKLGEKLVEQTTLRAWMKLQLLHNKYKRCLALAEWCDAEADVADADGDYDDMRWYQKWHERWLKLAKKFKEAKCR